MVLDVRESDGVRVVNVGGVTCYSHTGDTEVHDALRQAVRDIVVGESGLCPERKGADPGWFVAAEEALQSKIHWRNRAMEKYWSGSKAERRRLGNRSGPKQELKKARAVLKQAVRKAKSEWIVAVVAGVNGETKSGAAMGGPQAWQAVKKLLQGLQKTKRGKAKRMRKADGTMSTSAEEDAKVFEKHFQSLYGRTAEYDLSVLSKIAQRKVRVDLDGEPTREEIVNAVKALKVSGPGCTGVSAAEWKSLIFDDECLSWLVQYVVRFWRCRVQPGEWEDGGLKILEKKGDLADPNNYRGIMLLEVAMKVVANVLKVRLVTISETLPHEMQNGFRPGRGCSDGTHNVRFVLRKLKEHGQSCWLLLLDFIKAFDRVPRELLWPLMAKLGVPPALLNVLRALHKTVNVKFSVEGVEKTAGSTVGFRQGDLLDPILSNFHVAGAMMAWQQKHPKTR